MCYRSQEMNVRTASKRNPVVSPIIALVLAGLFASSSVMADPPSWVAVGRPADTSHCFSVDLRTGELNGMIPANMEFIVPPEDAYPADGDGYYETVLRISLAPTSSKWATQPRSVAFIVDYDTAPTGFTVNIGDSATNNGFAGDGASQSNDAELTVGGLQSGSANEFDEMRIYGHDGTFEARGVQQLAQVSNVTKAGETLTLAVTNEWLGYRNKSAPIAGVMASPWLFALKGQPDSEGPVNYDIYASFNRVITGTVDRFGTGASKVKICTSLISLSRQPKHHHSPGKTRNKHKLSKPDWF